MIEKIDHIGIAVENLDTAVKTFEQILGVECGGIEEINTQKVKVAFLSVGETKIELLEGISSDSPITKFLEKGGHGVHHLALEVQDISKELERLKAVGIKLIDQEPRTGAHGTKVAFIHPKSSEKVLCELVEKNHE